MAAQHKVLFEPVTLIVAARGSCASATLKPLLAICWGHQKLVNPHLHQHRKRIKSQRRTLHDQYSNSPEMHFPPKLSRSHSKGKVDPQEGIRYSKLIAKKLL